MLRSICILQEWHESRNAIVKPTLVTPFIEGVITKGLDGGTRVVAMVY